METLRFFPTTRLLLISRLPERFGEPAVGEGGTDCGEEIENCFEVEMYSNTPIDRVCDYAVKEAGAVTSTQKSSETP